MWPTYVVGINVGWGLGTPIWQVRTEPQSIGSNTLGEPYFVSLKEVFYLELGGIEI
jgi:hypothetical protein